jgi:gamma-glutamyltranspeptidase/glutathione hydrolase
MIAGTGLFLNNEMDDFSIKPNTANSFGLVGADANAIAPHKRMLSSVTPSFVEAGDRLMIGGSPGGSLIMGMVLLATLDFIDGHSASEIVAAPRFHHQYLPDVVRYEGGAFSERSSRRSRAGRYPAGDLISLGEFPGRDLEPRHRGGGARPIHAARAPGSSSK